MRYRIVTLALSAAVSLGALCGPVSPAAAAPPLAQHGPPAVLAQGTTAGVAPALADRRTVLGPNLEAPRGGCPADKAALIRRIFAYVGADRATQNWFVAKAWSESGCGKVLHAYRKSTRDDSFGPFMVNRWGSMNAFYDAHGWSRAEMATFHDGTAAAAWLWARCGRGPWIPPYSCNG